MKKRLLTGIVMIAILLAFIGLREINLYFFDVFIGIIMVCSCAEVSRVFIRSKQYNNMTLVTIFPIFYYLAFMFCSQKNYQFWVFALIILCLLIIFALTCLLIVLLDKKSTSIEIGKLSLKKYRLNKFLLTVFLLIYPTLLLGIMFIFNHTTDLIWFNNLIKGNLGLFLLTLLFSISMFTDTFAYLVGSTFKGPKLCPFISPKKTVSGAIGGLLGGILASVLCFVIFNNISAFATFFSTNNVAVWQFIIYGAFASIATQIGDIFASWIKRKALTKDFSSIFPGHGGFMDRFDGFSFNAIITLIFSLIIFA